MGPVPKSAGRIIRSTLHYLATVGSHTKDVKSAEYCMNYFSCTRNGSKYVRILPLITISSYCFPNRSIYTRNMAHDINSVSVGIIGIPFPNSAIEKYVIFHTFNHHCRVRNRCSVRAMQHMRHFYAIHLMITWI